MDRKELCRCNRRRIERKESMGLDWKEDGGRSGCLGSKKIKKREREREQKTRENQGGLEVCKEGIWFGYRCGGKHS